MSEQWSVEDFKPVGYADSLGDKEEKEESDGFGLPAVKHQNTLRLQLEDGLHALCYAHIQGSWINPEETRIELVYSGLHRRKDKWEDGTWLAVIEGKRLGRVFVVIASATQPNLHTTKGAEGKPVVTKMWVEEMG